MHISYDLSEIFPNINAVKINNECNENNSNKNNDTMISPNVLCSSYKTENGEYSVLKYDKEKITNENVSSLGLFRSVITKDGVMKGFSPPKSLNREYFMEKYPITKNKKNNCYAEEFVEGTMINLFYDDTINDWVICTKSKVGARNVFFKESTFSYDKTFRFMFLNAAEEIGINFDKLPKDYCYSFVLQHPKNRIVTLFIESKIYLIGCYKINNETNVVTEISRSEKEKIINNMSIDLPNVYEIDSYENMYERWANKDLHYTTMGILIKNDSTGERTKIRNPNYEYVRRLRGNQPKLQYRYLQLRQERNVTNYLKYFKEAKDDFTRYKNEVHDYTAKLYSNYISCYVKKDRPLINYTLQYRNHMFKLHQLYLDTLKDNNEKITYYKVIEYVNNLHSAQLMHNINFDKYKQCEKETEVNEDVV